MSDSKPDKPKRPVPPGLRPWPKGVSGNPSGRPKKQPLTEAFRAWLELPIADDMRERLGLPKGATNADGVAKRTGQQALMAKSHLFAKELREATEGKAAQRLEISTPEDREVVIRVLYEGEKKEE